MIEQMPVEQPEKPDFNQEQPQPQGRSAVDDAETLYRLGDSVRTTGLVKMPAAERSAEDIKPPDRTEDSKTDITTVETPAKAAGIISLRRALEVVSLGADEPSVEPEADPTRSAVPQPELPTYRWRPDTETTPPDLSADSGGRQPPDIPPPPTGGNRGDDWAHEPEPEPPESNEPLENSGQGPAEELTEAEKIRLAKARGQFGRLTAFLQTSDQSLQEDIVDRLVRRDLPILPDIIRSTDPDSALAKRYNDTNLVRLEKFADTLAKRWVDDKTSVEKAAAIFTIFCWTSDELFVRLSDLNPNLEPRFDNNGNFFVNQLAASIISALPRDAVNDAPPLAAFFDGLDDHINRIESTGVEASWMRAKMNAFALVALDWAAAERSIERQETLVTADLAELKRNNDRLAEEIAGKRSRTIKPATHEAGPNEVWSISDAADVREQMIAEITDGNPLRPNEWSASKRLIAIEHHEDSPPELEIILPQVGMTSDPELINRAVADSPLVSRKIIMDDRGELHLTMVGHMPLRPMYERAGKEVNYEALRQYFLKVHFDLTVPIEVARQAQRATNKTYGEDAKTPSLGRDASDQVVVYDLLLPRIKVLRQYTNNQFEAIVGASDEDIEVKRGERPDYSDMPANVVGHIMKLPEGYKPSLEALARAEKAGVVVPPGHTFVKAHYHPGPGSRGTKTIHRAKRRPDNTGNQQQSTTPTNPDEDIYDATDPTTE